MEKYFFQRIHFLFVKNDFRKVEAFIKLNYLKKKKLGIIGWILFKTIKLKTKPKKCSIPSLNENVFVSFLPPLYN